MPLVLITALTLALSGCTSSSGRGADADEAEATDSQSETGDGSDVHVTDGADDDDGPAREAVPGSLTLVTTRVSVLLDRHCDHDGDGIGDNAAADLGAPASSLFAVALGEAFQAKIQTGQERIMLRFSKLDDRLGPSHSGPTELLIYEGTERDIPSDPSDDFSGHEDYAADMNTMDPCGEPSHVFRETQLVEGTLSSGLGALPLPLRNDAVLAMPDSLIDGNIEPLGAAADLRSCGIARVASLGAATDYRGGLSLLEIILSGGAAFGLPTVPGVSADVDVDGDGLERFELDSESALVRCIDGDDTVIEGSDCWADARIADGFSLVLGIEAVGALLAGRHPVWVLDESCDGVASPSLWSECATDEDCRPGTTCQEMTEVPRDAGIFLCVET